MDDNLIATPPKNYINKLFRNALNPMAVTKASDGTYIEVNEAFTKCMGLRRQEIIGQTSVGCGYITAQQRAVISDEIKEKGYAQNIELEVRVKNNERRYALFNSSMIKAGNDGLWLTVVTDISEHRRVMEARQDDILFKSLAAVEGRDVILIHDHQRQPYSSFINEEAKRVLHCRPLNDLLAAPDGRESAYFHTAAGCYHVKTILTRHGSSGKIILLEPLPYAVSTKENPKQHGLTRRQKEVALLTARGYSNKKIAEKLSISEYTVKDHLKEIFQIMGVGKRSELCSIMAAWR